MYMQNSREYNMFLGYLKEYNLRITSQRVAIFSLLIKANEPLSIKQIVKGLPDINFVTIYRNLDSLERVGIIHKIPMGFKYKYELSDNLRTHHHHLVCNMCGKSESISDKDLERQIDNIALNGNFKLTMHIIELRGVCGSCLNLNR